MCVLGAYYGARVASGAKRRELYRSCDRCEVCAGRRCLLSEIYEEGVREGADGGARDVPEMVNEWWVAAREEVQAEGDSEGRLAP